VRLINDFQPQIRLGSLGIDLTSAETKPAGLAFLKQRIGQSLPGITAYIDGFNHDLCDAAIAAYTAFLHSRGKTELCGEPEEGAICLPFLDRVIYDY